MDGTLPAGGVDLRVRWWTPPRPRGGVVVVHGLGDHGLRYEHVAQALAARGFTVMAPDLRGHGESPGRRGDAPRMSDLAADLGDAVSELRRTLPAGAPMALVGHSLGGLLVLRYLQGDGRGRGDVVGPVFSVPRGIVTAVLSSPWLRVARPVSRWKRLLARILLATFPARGIRVNLSSAHLTRDPEQQRAHDADPLVHDLLSARLFREIEEAQQEAWDAAPRLNLPILLVVPGEDRVVDSEVTLRLADRFAGHRAPVIRIPGGRHEAFHDLGREELIRQVAEWIDARLTAAANGGPPERGGDTERTPARIRDEALTHRDGIAR